MKLGTKTALAMSVTALVAVPAAALANAGTGNPPGLTTSQQHQTQSGSSTSTQSTAEKQCRSERTTMGTAAFSALFQTNKNKHNAFGKCVSKLANQDTADQASAHSTAEKTCRAAQSSDPTGFQQKYGNNTNGRNAFGMCVSSTEKTLAGAMENKQIHAQEQAAKTCHSLQMSNAATFSQTYGTGRNAFGKCVSQHAKSQQTQTSSS
jgi:hypothetical protein